MPEHTLLDLIPAARPRRWPTGLAVRVALAVLIAASLAGGLAVAAPTTRPSVPAAESTPLLPVPSPPVPPAAGPPSCVAAGCRGRNPHTSGCDRDAVTIGQSPLTTQADPTLPGWAGPTPAPGATAAEAVVGYVQVRWSPSCRAGWALALAAAPCAIGTLAIRRDDDAEQARAIPRLTGREPSRAYTAMLDVAPAGRLVGLVAPPDDGRGLLRDSTGFVTPLDSPRA